MTVSSRTYWYFALSLIGTLLLLHGIGTALPHDAQVGKLLRRLFYLDAENNISAICNALLILFNGLLAYFVFAKEPVRWRAIGWLTIAVAMLFLGLDEACRLHEQMGDELTKRLGVGSVEILGFHLYWLWVIPYIIFAGLFFAAVLRLLLDLPSRIRALMILSGAIYVGAAAGLESVAGWLKHTPAYAHWIALEIPVEEGLEMLAMALFGRTLLEYLERYKGTVSIRFGAQPDYAEIPADTSPSTGSTL